MARRGTSGPGGRGSHQEAVTRRLEQLSQEWEVARGGTSSRVGSAGSRRPVVGSGPPPQTHTRVRGGPPQAELAPDPVAEPAARAVESHTEPVDVPVPGRHARRRPGGGWLPETLRGRLALSGAQVGVVAVLVAVGLAVTTWWVLRGDADPVPVSDPGGAASTPAPLASPAGAADEAESATAPIDGAPLVVDVAGKVRRPGLVELPTGSRVADALEAAGGARRGVSLSGLNLARPLVDGEQILVGRQAPPGLATGPLPTGSPTGSTVLVNLNTADQATLETLPQVGPVTAAAIIAWRTEHGAFTAVEELLEVDGIGDATLAEIAPHATV